MAWIYFQESAGSRSGSALGSDPLPIVKTTPTLKRSSLLEWLTAYCPGHQFGMTFVPSAAPTCLEESISFTVGSLVRTYPRRASIEAWRASGQGLLLRSGDWLMKYDPVLSSWKTCQASLLTEWTPSLPRLPNAGLMRDGFVFPHSRWERAIFETDGGYSLMRLEGRLIVPTPISRDWKDGKAKACANIPVNGYLGRAVHKLPEALKGNGASQDGQLSPRFIEELMGYKIGWTELELWGIQWWRLRRRRLSLSSRGLSKEAE